MRSPARIPTLVFAAGEPRLCHSIAGFWCLPVPAPLLRWERAGAGGSRAPKWRRWKGFFEPTPRWDSFHYARAQRRSYIVSFMSSGIEAATS